MLRLICGIVLLEAAYIVFSYEKSKAPCVDKYGMCSYWAIQGECEKNTDYMMANCRRSCYFCGDLDCDVGIAGGGISGLYIAYKLLIKRKERHVCVFERENRTGGRILDHTFKEAPDIYFGLGAWRIKKNSTLVIALLRELGIEYYDWNLPLPDLYVSRGTRANNPEAIKKGFPNLVSHPVFGNMTIGQLLSYALKPEHVANANNFATVNSYFSHYITPEGAAYLSDIWFFKSVFEEIISLEPFFDYFKYLKQFSRTQYVRPLRGMSEITTTLANRIVSLGGKIYTNSPVKQLMKRHGRYFLITPTMKARIKKLVIALTPLQIGELTGDVAERIKRTAQLKSIKSFPGFKGFAVYTIPWWENVTISGTPVDQWRSLRSHINCVGWSMVWGKSKHGAAILNTFYNGGGCARKWRDISKLGKDVLNREAHRALEMKYGIKIPRPIDTVYKFWDVMIHFQNPGFNFTLKDIKKWARRPFPGEDIFLVNEAFNPLRGWCEGAVNSCENALNEGWGG